MNDEWWKARFTKAGVGALVLILVSGIALRTYRSASFNDIGFDEHMYATYVTAALHEGIWHYDRVITEYLASQAKHTDAIVPATRIGFIWPAVVIARCNGGNALGAVYLVSMFAADLLLILTAVIAIRFGSQRQALIVTALMAVAPLQIFLGQRALGDEYFAFWSIVTAWCFLESLIQKRTTGWILAYGISFFVLILCKENAAFVCAALLATWVALCLLGRARWSVQLALTTVTAGLAAITVLCCYVGGAGHWVEFYRDYASKSAAIPYVIRFQDGAWYRYLVDFTVLSPLIVALAFGRVGNLPKGEIPDLFWALFLGFSFVAMSSVNLGMSLRFAAYWDEPLRWLAASQLIDWTDRFSASWRRFVLIGATIIVVAIDLTQYGRLFVRADIYDPVSMHLLRASKLVK